MLIGLAGKFGAGKDAVGDVLVERFGFKKLSFAEPLRRECAELLSGSFWSYPKCIPWLLRIQLCLLYKPFHIWVKPTLKPIRRLLQLYGTDYRRAQDPDYWVKQTAAYLNAHRTENIVITDARFPNEAALVRQYGALWLVHRPSQQLTEHHAHVSEAFVDQYSNWDLVIHNDGDLAQLDGKVSAIMRCEQELARIAKERLTATSPSHRAGLTLGECDWIAERGLIAAARTTEQHMRMPNPESKSPVCPTHSQSTTSSPPSTTISQ